MACAVIAGLVTATAVVAQEIPVEPSPAGEDAAAEIERLHAEAVEEYTAGRYAEAIALWREILEQSPTDTIALYNAACAQVKLGSHDKALNLLEGAILCGFVNFERLKRDPDLAPLHGEERFQAILATIDEAYAKAADHMQEWARQALGEKAIVERDERYRIIYGTSLDRETFDRVKATLDKQIAMQIEAFFGDPPNSYVLLLVPTPTQADAILQSVRIGGYYDHDTRRLVMRDVGPALRHEMTHALHHAQMDRLGQDHPMWIQEGLASMFEMYDLDDAGGYVVRDNTRLNIVLNLRGAASLTPWNKLFADDDRRFVRSRPRAKYAEARAVFQYLAEKGRLEEWYRVYVEEIYVSDRSGAAAFERVFGQPLDATERDYRLWLATKAKVAEEVDEDLPALGLWVADQGANDGVLIVGVNPGGAAKRAGVRGSEVIVAVDGKPVYVVEEVVNEILVRGLGAEVTLRLRHGIKYREVKVPLRPVKPSRHVEVVQPPGVPV